MPARRKAPFRKIANDAIVRKVIGDTIEYITPVNLVRRWDSAVTLGTLKNWRSKGRGPPWTKLERQVVYPLLELAEWESKNTFR